MLVLKLFTLLFTMPRGSTVSACEKVNTSACEKGITSAHEKVIASVDPGKVIDAA